MRRLRIVIALLMVGSIVVVAFGQAQPPATVRPPAAVAGWKSAVDPVEIKGKPRTTLQISVPMKNEVQGVTPSRPSPYVAIGESNGLRTSSWSILNLNAGGLVPAFTMNGRLDEPMLSPDGQYLAGKTRAAGQPGALEVWSIKPGKQLQRIVSEDKNRPPEPLGFAAGDQILCAVDVRSKPHLQAWDLKTGNKNWEVEIPRSIDAKASAVSPGGKYVALIEDKALLLIDTGKGETVNKVDLPPTAQRAFGLRALGVAFSHDGTQLAAYFDLLGKARLVVWDLASGSVLGDHVTDMPRDERWTRSDTKLEYFADIRLLRFSNHVLDRETGTVIYTIPQSRKGRNDTLVKAVGERSVLAVSDRDRDRVWINIATMPKAELEKTAAVVQSGGKASDANLPALSKADYSTVRVALDAGAPAAWSLKVDVPAKTPGANTIALRAQRPPGGEDYAVKAIAFSGAPANQIAVAYQVRSNAGTKTVVDRIGLSGGIAAGSFDLPDQMELLDLSADGKLILLQSGSDRLDLYSLAAGAAKPVVAFRPYAGDKNGEWIKFAAIVSPEQIVTISISGRLVLWNVQGAKAVYEMTTQRDGFALSPSRKWLAVASGSGVSIIDVTSGQVLGSLSGVRQQIFAATMAFHPDGSKLAFFMGNPYPRLQVFDLATGKILADSGLPKEAGAGRLSWADGSHILISGLLFDLDLKAVVWKYVQDPFAPRLTGVPDNRWAFVHGAFNQHSALIPVAIPHPEAKQALAGMKPEQNLAVGPGTKVTIQVGITGDAAFQKKVTDALTKHVQDAGWVVADGSDVVLIASTTSRESKSVQYHVIGGNPAQQTVTIPSYECKLEITKGGQSVWQALAFGGNNAPSFTNLKKGQMMQDVVNEINANPGGGFYDSVTFPTTISKPLEKIGTSKITLKGIVPAE